MTKNAGEDVDSSYRSEWQAINEAKQKLFVKVWQ